MDFSTVENGMNEATDQAPEESSGRSLVWSDSLQEELELFLELVQVASTTRDASLDPAGSEFGGLLERQTEILGRLQEIRSARAEVLRSLGFSSKDLLVIALNQTPRSEHASVMELFSRYIEAAERAQCEVEINREYFGVALGAVEHTIAAVTKSASNAPRYDARGQQSEATPPICMSTVT